MKSLKGLPGLILGGVCLVLSACATDESINRDVEVKLEPYAAPAEPAVGTEIHGFDKGKPMVTKIVAIKDGTVTRQVIEGSMKGCMWTRGTGENQFAPPVSWQDCRNGSTGTQKFTKTGNIWPLVVGNEESYKVTGQNQNNTWQTVRKCRVAAAVQVSIEDKQYPTYEVVCRDEWSTRTWYISPDLKRSIKFKNLHKSRGVDNDWVAKLD